MPQDNCPILVGCGRVTQKDADPVLARGPLDLMEDTIRLAAEDAGPSATLLKAVDHLRIVEFLTGVYDAPCQLLASRLGLTVSDAAVTNTGGNTPQLLINETAEKLARGECTVAILTGAETLQSFFGALTQGKVPEWVERDAAQPAIPPLNFEGSAPHEVPYECQLPANVYPFFENALRAKHGRTIEEHANIIGKLYSGLSQVAAKNPEAWFNEFRSSEEITTESPRNRYIGFPYTKFMNAIIRVDQSATVIMTTVGNARELGIDESKWVYLHGCGNAEDHWYISNRENYHSSPAIRAIGREALAMAECTIEDIDHFDLYSCFPSAVQIAMDELGIAHDDPRPMTVTGGLAYHGGPANNYVMHSIAEMMLRLRAGRGSKGLCTGLGWFITKHALGIYSTDAVEGEWKRSDPETYQAEIHAGPSPEFIVEANGSAHVETYTVLYEREGPAKGIVIGRLEDGSRFMSVTAKDPELFEEMTTTECVGRKGSVAHEGGLNYFTFHQCT